MVLAGKQFCFRVVFAFNSITCQVFQISFRRGVLQENMINDHFQAVISCIFQMKMYSLYLCMSPAREAALLVESNDPLLEQAKTKIWQSSKCEWETILKMENAESSNTLLKKNVPSLALLEPERDPDRNGRAQMADDERVERDSSGVAPATCQQLER